MQLLRIYAMDVYNLSSIKIESAMKEKFIILLLINFSVNIKL
jgi:hypothetical protein